MCVNVNVSQKSWSQTVNVDQMIDLGVNLEQ